MNTPPPTLLIVDDNPNDVDFIRDAFADLAIAAEFVVANDGVEAIEVLTRVKTHGSGRPSAVLLDLNMPRVSGREVLAFIKGSVELRQIPTIILTSSASPKDKADCLANGADAYLTKPSTLEQLNILARQIHGMIQRGPDAMSFEARPSAGFAPLGWIDGVVALCLRPRSLA